MEKPFKSNLETIQELNIVGQVEYALEFLLSLKVKKSMNFTSMLAEYKSPSEVTPFFELMYLVKDVVSRKNSMINKLRLTEITEEIHHFSDQVIELKTSLEVISESRLIDSFNLRGLFKILIDFFKNFLPMSNIDRTNFFCSYFKLDMDIFYPSLCSLMTDLIDIFFSESLSEMKSTIFEGGDMYSILTKEVDGLEIFLGNYFKSKCSIFDEITQFKTTTSKDKGLTKIKLFRSAISSLELLKLCYNQDVVHMKVSYLIEKVDGRSVYKISNKRQHGGDRELYIGNLFAKLFEKIIEKFWIEVGKKLPNETLNDMSKEKNLSKQYNSLVRKLNREHAIREKMNLPFSGIVTCYNGDNKKWAPYFKKILFFMFSRFLDNKVGYFDELYSETLNFLIALNTENVISVLHGKSTGHENLTVFFKILREMQKNNTLKFDSFLTEAGNVNLNGEKEFLLLNERGLSLGEFLRKGLEFIKKTQDVDSFDLLTPFNNMDMGQGIPNNASSCFGSATQIRSLNYIKDILSAQGVVLEHCSKQSSDDEVIPMLLYTYQSKPASFFHKIITRILNMYECIKCDNNMMASEKSNVSQIMEYKSCYATHFTQMTNSTKVKLSSTLMVPVCGLVDVMESQFSSMQNLLRWGVPYEDTILYTTNQVNIYFNLSGLNLFEQKENVKSLCLLYRLPDPLDLLVGKKYDFLKLTDSDDLNEKLFYFLFDEYYNETSDELSSIKKKVFKKRSNLKYLEDKIDYSKQEIGLKGSTTTDKKTQMTSLIKSANSQGFSKLESCKYICQPMKSNLFMELSKEKLIFFFPKLFEEFNEDPNLQIHKFDPENMNDEILKTLCLGTGIFKFQQLEDRFRLEFNLETLLNILTKIQKINLTRVPTNIRVIRTKLMECVGRREKFEPQIDIEMCERPVLEKSKTRLDRVKVNIIRIAKLFKNNVNDLILGYKDSTNLTKYDLKIDSRSWASDMSSFINILHGFSEMDQKELSSIVSDRPSKREIDSNVSSYFNMVQKLRHSITFDGYLSNVSNSERSEILNNLFLSVYNFGLTGELKCTAKVNGELLVVRESQTASIGTVTEGYLKVMASSIATDDIRNIVYDCLQSDIINQKQKADLCMKMYLLNAKLPDNLVVQKLIGDKPPSFTHHKLSDSTHIGWLGMSIGFKLVESYKTVSVYLPNIMKDNETSLKGFRLRFNSSNNLLLNFDHVVPESEELKTKLLRLTRTESNKTKKFLTQSDVKIILNSNDNKIHRLLNLVFCFNDGNKLCLKNLREIMSHCSVTLINRLHKFKSVVFIPFDHQDEEFFKSAEFKERKERFNNNVKYYVNEECVTIKIGCTMNNLSKRLSLNYKRDSSNINPYLEFILNDICYQKDGVDLVSQVYKSSYYFSNKKLDNLTHELKDKLHFLDAALNKIESLDATPNDLDLVMLDSSLRDLKPRPFINISKPKVRELLSKLDLNIIQLYSQLTELTTVVDMTEFLSSKTAEPLNKLLDKVRMHLSEPSNTDLSKYLTTNPAELSNKTTNIDKSSLTSEENLMRLILNRCKYKVLPGLVKLWESIQFYSQTERVLRIRSNTKWQKNLISKPYLTLNEHCLGYISQDDDGSIVNKFDYLVELSGLDPSLIGLKQLNNDLIYKEEKNYKRAKKMTRVTRTYKTGEITQHPFKHDCIVLNFDKYSKVYSTTELPEESLDEVVELIQDEFVSTILPVTSFKPFYAAESLNSRKFGCIIIDMLEVKHD